MGIVARNVTHSPIRRHTRCHVTASALSHTLATADTRPAFAGVSSQGTYADALAMLPIARAASAGVSRFGPDGQTTVRQYLQTVQKIVAAGASAFDQAADVALLTGAPGFVDAVTQGKCEAFKT
jgi:hypothetical protein